MKKNKKVNISVIGTGYVGLVSGTCFAQLGHNVICVDSDVEKIKRLKKGISPIYEAGLEKLIVANVKKNRLSFTDDITRAVRKSEAVFISVNTPTKKNGKTDLRFVENVSRKIAKAMDCYKVIVSKSTMPVKTGQRIKKIIGRFCREKVDFDVVSNPEFLREGTAVGDFLKPDRIVIGLESERAKKIMEKIYQPINSPVIFTSIESAELIKHSCNAFLASKISFINAIANICEKNRGDIEQVALAMGLDKRIGRDFLRAGLGFGGSCLPKDLSAFIKVAKDSGYDFKLLKEAGAVNKNQRALFFKKIEGKIKNLKGKRVAVLGLSFKPGTDDIRESPAIDIVNLLLEKGALVRAYDPVAMEKARSVLGGRVNYCNNLYEAAQSADFMVILTEWDEFSKMDLLKLKKILKKPVIFDGRNIFNPQKMKKMGFDYISIGRNEQ